MSKEKRPSGLVTLSRAALTEMLSSLTAKGLCRTVVQGVSILSSEEYLQEQLDNGIKTCQVNLDDAEFIKESAEYKDRTVNYTLRLSHSIQNETYVNALDEFNRRQGELAMKQADRLIRAKAAKIDSNVLKAAGLSEDDLLSTEDDI